LPTPSPDAAGRGKVWYDDQHEVHRQIFEGGETINYAFMGQDAARQGSLDNGVLAEFPVGSRQVHCFRALMESARNFYGEILRGMTRHGVGSVSQLWGNRWPAGKRSRRSRGSFDPNDPAPWTIRGAA
jgi:hypothetical protein